MTDQQQQHPISPPRELIAKWMTEARSQDYCSITEQVAYRTAQWVHEQCSKLPACFHGVPLIPPVDCVDPQSWIAQRIYDMGYEQRGEVNEAQLQKTRDQELEACCDWLRHEDVFGEELALRLRAARRPKPSLKELALMALEDSDTGPGASLTLTEVSIIRRALEALPND